MNEHATTTPLPGEPIENTPEADPSFKEIAIDPDLRAALEAFVVATTQDAEVRALMRRYLEAGCVALYFEGMKRLVALVEPEEL